MTTFYNFADIFNLEHTDFWMTLFVQSLDGEVRKWFIGLQVNSIPNIRIIDEVLLIKWGDKKGYLYYMTEFAALKRN